MNTRILKRIRTKLARQRQNLLEWWQTAPPARKKIRTGPVAESAVQALARADDRTLGLYEVCHEYIEADRLAMDFTACVCIDHYSARQRRELEAELELSHKVQKALLPREIPQLPGLELAAFSQPAALVGGDYFDFFRFRDGAPGLAVDDVMGKGVPASMLMANLQAALRILVPESDGPAAVIRRLNRLFCHNVHLIKFITIFLARFEAGSRVLAYCNAGHNPPLLLRGREQAGPPLQWLQPTGAAIGLAKSFDNPEAAVTPAPGDVFVVYTDGVTEARNQAQEEFGEDRLAQTIALLRHAPPRDMIRGMRLALRDFTGRKGFADKALPMM
ncbi:MAG: PP2C family protein-serine/threonine phosphatase [candidate division KSB1 bacterium]|nr:PP2C family protein-serine/threonine phosphatase [candidate division KSB1 bacterium]MDZ7274439.1 PP2C family protein-serine/threonine phosphatase [candidate division KSB1 bacterium]MDZ7284899.1 PP2C family protein-serine/threonine phosphatase [candidate division KSB1 bacterium]MDZ7297680.1 PP2C family protein-serine/threonine phosphatase [candidate division KSB1 bacterium]MDZ7305896.1 PP2C family protein-serine/threonine phosphatase [candidate division KSB1 bacterium]